MSEIEWRLPVPYRIYGIVFCVVWCGLLGSIFIALVVQGSAAAVGPLLMAILGIVFIVRMLRVAVITQGDRLLVRNVLFTRRIARAEIKDFHIDRRPSLFLTGYRLDILITDGRVLILDVSYLWAGSLPGGRLKLGAIAAELGAWVKRGASGGD